MKVLYITPNYFPNLKGGSERSLKILAEGMAEKGVSVSVLSFDGESKETEEINGVKVIRIKKPKIKPNTIGMNMALLLNKKLVEKESPDIIHVYNTWHIPGSYFLRKYAPVVATLNNLYPICPISYTKDKLVEKGKIDSFSMFNGILKSYEAKPPINFLIAIAYVIYGKAVSFFSKRIDHFIAYAKAIRDIYLKAGFDKKKFRIISNLFNLKEKPIERKPKKNIALYVGGLMESKGVLELVEAFRFVDPSIQLRVVGTGLDEEKMKSIAKKHNLNVKFFGKLQFEDVKKHYSEASFLIQPSLVPEAFSRIWIECLYNKIPIISSDNPAAKEILGKGAIFYKRGNKKELAKKIELMAAGKLRLDQKESRKKLFSQNPTEEIYDLYKDILKNKRRAKHIDLKVNGR